MGHAWQKYEPFGGHAYLDFVNTIDDEDKTRGRNGLPDWATAVQWSLRFGVLSTDEALQLRQSSGGPAELARLLHLRERSWAVLSAAASGRQPADADLEALSKCVADAYSNGTLHYDDSAFSWHFEEGAGIVRRRLTAALTELMASGQLARLRECGRCTGLFLNHGRGVGRRWCRMSTCGNRAKIERFRADA